MGFKGIAALCVFLATGQAFAIDAGCPELSELVSEEFKGHCVGDYLTFKDYKHSGVAISAYEVSPFHIWGNPRYRDYDSKAELQKSEVLAQARNLHWDYGHLANEKITSADIKSRFLSFNRVPMAPALNRSGGVWNELEKYEIKMAKKLGPLKVLAGYSYNKDREQHYYFKIYISEHQTTASYLIPGNYVEGSIQSHISSMQCIEQTIDESIFNDQSNLIAETYNDFAFTPQVWTAGNNDRLECEVGGDI
ncbi:DNA/RNA non-specific endonuclease [Salinimonas chungwhensis]|uniref:DNA/RNA non-specific endonuclease n=1 Tax=Salinimonas chungwhensis TaxID=265425 RepID=UPI000379784D|nr:DNA/RNA non-specific endonuclease [Salinimonas chungwhensis]